MLGGGDEKEKGGTLEDRTWRTGEGVFKAKTSKPPVAKKKNRQGRRSLWKAHITTTKKWGGEGEEKR